MENKPAKIFHIHASQCSKIMGTGKAKRIPDNAPIPVKNFLELTNTLLLPVTCETFLREWHANDPREQIRSKYIDKGNACELEAIDFMARILGYGLAEKNKVTRSNEFMVGTCDVEFPDQIADVKCPWSKETLQENVYGKDEDYEWQLRVYMALWEKDKSLLFYALMDTPGDDYGRDEVIYSDLPDHDRWIAYRVTRDMAIETEIVERVKLCRVWLEGWDTLVRSRIGRIN